ncbi:LHFPL tetraspan subfamily member 7 protein-like [Tubulanus polymorphus]|uniref:LHFPL tetraspan subfamily member 7 protein-like n=1 Tax=Tubulanus polymorphus TaxID=672921 RepID=UPI003DA1F91F
MSSSPIGILWTILSIMVAGICSFAFMQPYWILEPDKLNCFGVLNYCVKDPRSQDKVRQFCGFYGGVFNYFSIPSTSWKATCALFGGGIALMGLSCLFCFFMNVAPKAHVRRLSLISGNIQVLAVASLITGLVVYPLGMKSPLIRHYCYGADSFDPGTCQVGWGYMLGIMGTGLSIFCPIMAHYVDVKVHDENPVIVTPVTFV